MEPHLFTKSVRDVLRKRNLVGHRITTTADLRTIIADVHEGKVDDVKRAVQALRHKCTIKVKDMGRSLTIEVSWHV